jgi:hypothetical protein
MRKLSKIVLFFTLFIVLFSFNACADSVVFNYPLGNETLNGTITLNATADYDCLNATFYYSNNASNPWQSFIGSNTTAGRNFTFSLNTNVITDGTYNFTVNVTNSTLVNFSTVTNITIENKPNWYNNTPPPDAQYSPNQTYQFNITWIDNDGLNEVILEFNGVNYTNSSGSLSKNGNVYNKSFTDLPAKAFTYRWIANDTYGNSNSTGNLTYVVAKNSSVQVNLTLGGIESNKTYFINQTANFTAFLNVSDKTIHLDSNCSSWNNLTDTNSSVTNTTNLTCSGLSFVTAYWNAENYTNKTFYFGVTNLSWSDNSTYSDSLNYTRNGNYSLQIKWTGNVSKVIFESDFNGSYVNYTGINITNWNKTISVNNDTAGNYWINFTDLSATSYHYRWLANDTNNVSIFTDQLIYTVNKSQIPSYSFYTSYGSWSIPISTTLISLICKNNTPINDSSVNFAINGVCSATGNPANCTFSTPPTAGYVICICEVLGISNYSLYVSQNLSYFTSGDMYTPTPPTGGSFTLTPSSSSITIEPNSSGTITFTLKNTYSYNFTKINITVSGIDASWYSLSKVNISVLIKNNGTDTSILTLNIPGDAERKNYTIIASAVGRDPSGYRLTRQASIKLIIPEIPQNVTNETNETESSNTTGIGSQTNQTNQTNVTGLSINIKEFVDYIVLIIASVVIILIFIFRNEFTGFIRGKKPEVHPEHKVHEESIVHVEPKKIHHIISHVKKKISSLSEHRLVIQIKKKEKKEEEKKT